jgi:hypothetical protein
MDVTVSNGENGNLASISAPLFASLFPERDRNCHLMVHENSDDGRYRSPLGYREGVPLNGLMTLQNFIDGGYDVPDAKILVVVKSVGSRKKSIVISVTHPRCILIRFKSLARMRPRRII